MGRAIIFPECTNKPELDTVVNGILSNEICGEDIKKDTFVEIGKGTLLQLESESQNPQFSGSFNVLDNGIVVTIGSNGGSILGYAYSYGPYGLTLLNSQTLVAGRTTSGIESVTGISLISSACCHDINSIDIVYNATYNYPDSHVDKTQTSYFKYVSCRWSVDSIGNFSPVGQEQDLLVGKSQTQAFYSSAGLLTQDYTEWPYTHIDLCYCGNGVTYGINRGNGIQNVWHYNSMSGGTLTPTDYKLNRLTPFRLDSSGAHGMTATSGFSDFSYSGCSVTKPTAKKCIPIPNSSSSFVTLVYDSESYSPYGSSVTYMVDGKCTYDGKSGRSLQDGNIGQTPQEGSGWTQIPNRGTTLIPAEFFYSNGSFSEVHSAITDFEIDLSKNIAYIDYGVSTRYLICANKLDDQNCIFIRMNSYIMSEYTEYTPLDDFQGFGDSESCKFNGNIIIVNKGPSHGQSKFYLLNLPPNIEDIGFKDLLTINSGALDSKRIGVTTINGDEKIISSFADKFFVVSALPCLVKSKNSIYGISAEDKHVAEYCDVGILDI